MKPETLKKLQTYMLECLVEIDRICKKHDITYHLIGGTLLGAVRHKGFIPWDDDLDIVMPREDYERFEKICEKELNEKYFLDSVKYNVNYPMPMPKVRIKNTAYEQSLHTSVKCMEQTIWVDIFPLDCAEKETGMLQTLQAKTQAIIGLARQLKAGIGSPKDYRILNRICCYLLSGLSNKTLYKLQTKIQTLNNKKKCEYYVNFASGYGFRKQTIPKGVYSPAKEVCFEGYTFYGLNDNEYFLRRIYGEYYMQLPPVEKRITHNPVRLSFNLQENDEVLDS